ncbi:hypothetical protein NGB36_05745 [Streptomyces sp. RB6PN25]|uniref:Beta-ketoacyl-[acyl-carrier-protein] synthase III C-terminal domain-containing protein n=1 Tax=Streptomyces humicola TaxID=2953240 RepID=A0ABT1PR07_9ACTN|nr:3-oxoacyl-[acyl-carrier-protein] synthase III C-terminal domain-containing protein [Streptomyces humicola]MCQ4080106.1 hypothetical protein [Streptomyces humicola]
MNGLQCVGIIGTGSCLPGVVPAAIPRQRGGVDRSSAQGLAAAAARRALDSAGVAPEQLSHVVVAGCAHGRPQHGVAALVRRLTGADRAAAFDADAEYGGFVRALTMAEGLLRGEAAGACALVVGVGAGAGAVVLGPVPRGRGTISTSLLTGGGIGAAVNDVLSRAGVTAGAVRHLLAEAGAGQEGADAGGEGAAYVPVALDRVSRRGLLGEGDVVLLCGTGSGGTVGCSLLRWAGTGTDQPWASTHACSF